MQFFLNFAFACLRHCNRLAPHPKGNLARNTKVDWGMRPTVHVRREMPKPFRNQSAGRMSKASTWPNDMESQTALWLRFHESAVAQTNVESAIVPRPTPPSILRPQSAAPANIVSCLSPANSGQNHHLDHAGPSCQHTKTIFASGPYAYVYLYIYIHCFTQAIPYKIL